MRPRMVLGVVALAAAMLRPGEARCQPASAPPPTGKPALAATVNQEAIYLDRVDAVMKKQLSLEITAGPQLRQFRAQVVSDMIDDLLLKQFLREHGPKVERAEVDKAIAAYTESLVKKGKTFADFLKESNQTEAEVRESWTTALQLSGYVKAQTTDDQLKKYYEQHRDSFDRVEVKASQIVVRTGPSTPATEKAAAREKLEALRAEIVAGKLDFAAAARKYSQCPSAADGGDLGFITRRGGLVDEAICKTAFALMVGMVSPVVESDFGLYLVAITERKMGTPNTFDKCVEEVRELYAEDARSEIVAKLRKVASIQITLP